ncbi:MAG: type I-E CRISPR-associated protein Cas6/Cse3/CasE [Candidatus Hinthialibacter antarcticus]|nr:type I-E CRISPR-associated protein Cas6/Cse3/CasE [Candidatus Hinthialibacter antarcticus]
MYLSRLMLNPENRQVQKDLSDCHNLHRTLLRAFEFDEKSDFPRNSVGLLHRTDIDPRARMPVVLAQSNIKPDWSNIEGRFKRYFVSYEEARDIKSVESAYQGLKQEQVLSFRLRANPTRKVNTKSNPDGTKSNGRREPIRGDREQIDWLKRKGDQAGFTLLSVALNQDVLDMRSLTETAMQVGEKNTHRMTFHSVLYEGRLRITNVDLFQDALRKGIGPAKAYGFGLLSIKRGS